MISKKTGEEFMASVERTIVVCDCGIELDVTDRDLVICDCGKRYDDRGQLVRRNKKGRLFGSSVRN